MKKQMISWILTCVLAGGSVMPVWAAPKEAADVVAESVDESIEDIRLEENLEEDVIKETPQLMEESTGADLLEGPLLLDEAHFPDANFRAYLSTFYDTDQDGTLSEAEIEGITMVITPSEEDGEGMVYDLTGIAYLTALEQLTLGAPVTMEILDLSQNLKLKKLDAKSSQLSALDLSANSQLTDLRLPANNLSSLMLPERNDIQKLWMGEFLGDSQELQKCSRLKEFTWEVYSPAGTPIDVSSKINLASYPELVSLDLYMGEFTNVNVSRNPKLQTLKIQYLEQTSLDLSQNTELRSLRLIQKSNAISFSLNLINNNNLEDIYLKLPNLNAFNVTGKSNLKTLKVYGGGNQLQNLDLSSCTSLETLTLQGLPIRTLNVSPLMDLRRLNLSLSYLEQLKLSGNEALQTLNVQSDAMGFLQANNSRLSKVTVTQKKTISLDKNFAFDLNSIPGFRENRLVSVTNAKRQGSVIYPTASKVTVKYKINAQTDVDNAVMALTVSGPFKPVEITGLSIENRNVTSIYCKWNKQPEVDGYMVYARNAETGEIEKRVDNKTSTSCNVTGLSAAGKYTIIVRSYKKFSNKMYLSDYSGKSSVTCYSRPKVPTVSGSIRGTTSKLTWKHNKVYSKKSQYGYVVYYSTKKKGTYTKLATLAGSKNNYSAKKLKKGKTYYFKVYAYVRDKDRSNLTYSGVSNLVQLTVK